MKKKRPIAVMLAALLCALPVAACAETPPEAKEEIAEDVPVDPTPELPAEPEITAPEQPEPQPEEPQPEEPEEPQLPVKAEYVYVRTDGLNVRAGAGTSYTSLGTLESDILLKYVGKTGDWYQTYYKNRTAYVSAKNVYTSVTVLDAGETDVENVIEEGLRLLGVPYVYGAVRLHDGKGNFLKGFTVKQFDCSSLMQYIFYRGANKLLDVTTRTQVLQGIEVKRENVRRGDLLFFTNASRYNKKGIERIGHVALYLGGNYILHTASDYAKVEQISAQRWNYFITARRVL